MTSESNLYYDMHSMQAQGTFIRYTATTNTEMIYHKLIKFRMEHTFSKSKPKHRFPEHS